MANYRNSRFCENLNIAKFETEGRYNIPVLGPYVYEPCEFVGFNFAKSAKDKDKKGLHFFVDDYQFERLWREPLAYINLIGEFHSIMTPDFSLYTDYPKALQIYNHYRKHWLAAYWQLHGITVYPTISWSDERSYDWCFDGEPVGGIVAVSSVGTQQNKESKRLFLRGYEEMMKRISPEWVIFYGKVPEECDWNVIRVNPHYDEIVKRRKSNEISVSAGNP